MTEGRKIEGRDEVKMELEGKEHEEKEQHHHEEDGKGIAAAAGKPSADELDKLDEPFLCYICLELVHKPVVNACGHMFCFWCVHLAMNSDTESYCPLCRNPYMHFPRVCEQLHFLLLKALPEAYRRRCSEVSKTETTPSPAFGDGLECNSSGEGNLNAAIESEKALPQNVEEDQLRDQDGQENTLESRLPDSSSSSCTSKAESDVVEVVRDSADLSSRGTSTSSSSQYVSESDLLCSGCQKLLYRPVVVNCGHIFCEGCVTKVEIEGECILKCSTCGAVHPGGFPQVCLELHQYLEQNFSVDYEKRKDEQAAQSPEFRSRSNVNKLELPDIIMKEMKASKLAPRMHPGVGCDGCGMYPMFGRRFQCIDCSEMPGYDLCWHCFQYGTNLAGRFNQQHKPEHRIHEVAWTLPVFDPDFIEAEGG